MKESAGPNASAVVGNIDKCPWLEPVWSVQPLSSAFWPVARRISERNQSDRSNGRWIVCKKKKTEEKEETPVEPVAVESMISPIYDLDFQITGS